MSDESDKKNDKSVSPPAIEVEFEDAETFTIPFDGELELVTSRTILTGWMG